MSDPRSPPKRDALLRLALYLERHYAVTTIRPDPLQQLSEQVRQLRRLADHRRLCQARHWHKADQVLALRQVSQLRELQYLLTSVDRTVPQPRTPVTASLIYRDLQALAAEFDDLTVADDLSTVSAVTDPVTLEGISLGRFRLELDLGRLSRGRTGGDCLHAEALDPNPASCNDEITHPHVQAGQVCLGDGAVLWRAALAEGRLYDAFTVVNRVLHTYNDASPYVALDRWNGRVCDECDDVVREDETYACEACGNTLCSGCEHRCCDCDCSYCRSCLTAKDGDLLCSGCLGERVTREEEEAEQDEDDETDGTVSSELPQPHTPSKETHHAQETTPG